MIVLSDVHMPDMDGFKLLEHIGLEMDLPVIMMSADDSKSVVMKGVTHGACDYLIKPVRIEALRNIWQHVVRRRKHEWKDFEPLISADDADHQPPKPPMKISTIRLLQTKGIIGKTQRGGKTTRRNPRNQTGLLLILRRSLVSFGPSSYINSS